MSTAIRTYDRRSTVAWALYDFANSSFTTLVVTFIYATYFTKAIAADEVTGTALWSRAITVTALVVALLSPFMGALADRGGYRKLFLLCSTCICIVSTVALYFLGAGQIWSSLGVFVVANIAFEMGNVFYNAYLPDLAPLEKIGRISGYGWALGYVGGLLCLVVALFALVNPEQPILGFSRDGGENIRATNLLVAVWFAVFSIPMFLFVHDRKPESSISTSVLIRSAGRELTATLARIRSYRQIVRLLVARLVYNDGLVTVFSFGGIYAGIVFEFTFEQIMVFGIAINLAAGLGAYLFGFMDDGLGGKTTILVSLAGLFCFTCLALVSRSPSIFWVAGIGIGLLSGPNQSASRSLLGRFVPPDKENEFYGFYAFSGKATSFLGPLLLGVLTEAFGSLRAGMAVIAAFFVVGGILLLRVDEKEGHQLAHPSQALPPQA